RRGCVATRNEHAFFGSMWRIPLHGESVRTVLGVASHRNRQPARWPIAETNQTYAANGVPVDHLGSERSGNHATGDFGINAVVREDTTLDQALNDGDAHALVSFRLTYQVSA